MSNVTKRKVGKTAESSNTRSKGPSTTGITSDSRDPSGDPVQSHIVKSAFQRCLSAVKYVFILLIIPPFLNYAALLQEEARLLPPGALYDIGLGQKMFLGCSGTGVPTVIFDAATGMSSDVWNLVFSETAKMTKACVYDRAGLGFSSRPYKNSSKEAAMLGSDRWKPYTVERMVDDLHRLITFSSHQERPLLFVGAEMGSLVARFYTQVYESDVSDVVLIDPLTEDLFLYDSSIWSDFWWRHLVPSWQAMHLSAAFGVSRLALMFGAFEPPFPKHDAVSVDTVRRQKHLLCNPRHVSSVVDEHFFINDTFSQMQTLFRMKSFPSNVGVTVISSSVYDSKLPSELNEVWMQTQHNLATKLHPNAEHLFADNVDRNTIYWDRSELIVERIRQLVHRYRTSAQTQAS